MEPDRFSDDSKNVIFFGRHVLFFRVRHYDEARLSEQYLIRDCKTIPEEPRESEIRFLITTVAIGMISCARTQE